jgi:hypothetical protein
MVIKVRGILDFTQLILQRNINHNLSGKELQSLKPIVNLIVTWFLKKRFNLELNKTLEALTSPLLMID